jgi:hypothetical protein
VGTKRIDTEPGPGLSHNPFAALADRKASLQADGRRRAAERPAP